MVILYSSIAKSATAGGYSRMAQSYREIGPDSQVQPASGVSMKLLNISHQITLLASFGILHG
jgi:hypothetical protein